MSESSSPPNELPPDVLEWVRQMFIALRLGTLTGDLGETEEARETEETGEPEPPLEDIEGRRAALAERLKACTPPKDAAPQEAATIEAQSKRIAASLGKAANPADFGQVEDALGTLETVVTAVAEQVGHRRARATRLAGGLKSLMAAAKEAGAAGAEAAKAIPKLAAGLSAPWTDAGLDHVQSEIERFDKLLDAALFDAVLTARAKTLANVLRSEVTPGLAVLDPTLRQTRLTEQTRLAMLLSPPYAKTDVDEAEAAIKRMQTEIAAAGQTLTEDAASLRTEITAMAAPKGANKEDEDALERSKSTLLKGLDGPLTPEALTTVRTGIPALETEIEAIATEVQRRRESADDLIERAKAVDDPDGLNKPEETELEKLRNAVGEALTEPLDDTCLGAADTALQALTKRRGEVETAVKGRREDAQELIRKATAVGDPPGVPKDEETELAGLRGAVGKALEEPLDDGRLEAGDTALSALTQRHGEIVLAIAARTKRAGELPGEATALDDPPDCIDTEIAELKTLRDAVTKGLAVPYSGTMMATAEAALKALEDARTRIDLAAKEREALRTTLTDALDKAKLADELTGRVRAKLIDARRKLRKGVAEKKTLTDLKALETPVAGFEKDNRLATDVAKARVEAEKKVAKARKDVTAAIPDLDGAGFSFLMGIVKQAEAELATATTSTDMSGAGIKADNALSQLATAKAFSTKLEEFRTQSEVVVEVQLKNDTNYGNAKAKREAALAEAVKQAGKGKFSEAETALAGFAADAGVSPTDLTEAKKFADASLDFERQHRRDFDKLVQFESKDLSLTTLENQHKAAVAHAKTGAYATGVTAITQLITDYTDTDRNALVDLLKRFKRLSSDTTVGPDYTLAQTDYGAGNFATGVGRFTPHETTHGATLDYNKRKSQAANRRAAVRKMAQDNGIGAGVWALVESKCNSGRSNISHDGDIDDMNTEADRLEPLFEIWAEVRSRALRIDSSLAILDPEKSTIAGAGPMPSKTTLEALRTRLDAVESYHALKYRAAALKVAVDQGADSGLKTFVGGEITTATDEAETQAKWADAVTRLEALLGDKRVEETLIFSDAYIKLRDRAAKVRDGVLRLLDNAPTKAVANKLFDDAVDLATGKNDYAGAMTALEGLFPLYADLKTYAGERKRTRLAADAYKRQRAIYSAAGGTKAARITELDKKLSETDLNARLQAAEDHVTKTPPDTKSALKSYEALRKRMKDALLALAAYCEADDAADSNAGHSIDRHGPQVPNDLLLRRLQEGIDPLGNPAATGTSSRFEDIADWMACREAAWADADSTPVRDSPASTTDYDIHLSAEKVPCHKNSLLRMQVITDHGRPIDKAFDGQKPKPSVDTDGAVKPGRTHDTYREYDGLSKTRTLFLFEIDSPDTTTDRPKSWKDYRDRWRAAQTPAATSGPDYMTGRWVMMQHFPEASGWNPETGTYED